MNCKIVLSGKSREVRFENDASGCYIVPNAGDVIAVRDPETGSMVTCIVMHRQFTDVSEKKDFSKLKLTAIHVDVLSRTTKQNGD